jgi:DNA-binding transcriptional ArsR family regulator
MEAGLRALADETRRRILALVSHQERPAGELATHFSLTRPAISQHLSVLLACQLISVRREGTRRLYRVNRDALAQLRAQLDAFWDDHLDRLKTAAERAEKRKRKRR